ncbi:MAG: helix-turn-helix domain-containing protein [Tissierellia bacterium]|nr:helix-turn-helix domain-containing protein [Tissierellia bacterium]
MINNKIREARKNKLMTLNDLASAIGVTASYISQLERNIIEPSISTLRKISRELEVPMYCFFEEEDKDPILIRSDQRKELRINNNIKLQYISPVSREQGTKLELFLFHMEPNNENDLCHNSDECIFIIEGTVKILLEKEVFILENGDSIYIKENIPYKIYNDSEIITTGLITILPANT